MSASHDASSSTVPRFAIIGVIAAVVAIAVVFGRRVAQSGEAERLAKKATKATREAEEAAVKAAQKATKKATKKAKKVKKELLA